MQTRRRNTGFTMIEACCTMTIAGALLSAGVPSLQQAMTKRVLEGVSASVAADLMHVRSEAVARNESVRISFKPAAAGSCYVMHTGSAADCTCNGVGPAVCTGDAKELKTVFWPDSGKVRVAANVGSMLFDPVHGTAVPAGTIRITSASGQAIHHVVNIMGRPRACSPLGSVPGYKPC